MNKEIESIRKTYNSNEMLKTYGNAIDVVGLWESEKIIFNKYVSTEKSILDLGCGAGRTTINLYKNGYKNIVGLDISNNFIEYAKSYCKESDLDIEFICADATNLDFASDNSYDVVFFSYNGMQCIPGKRNRDNVLKEVHRVLKPGGIYIFTAHNRDASRTHKVEWEEEKIRWEEGTQDKELEIYGDKYSINPNNGERVFIHFSNIEEMKEFIYQENFEILEYIKREEIAQENEAVKTFSNSTYFWVIKKV